MAGRASLTMVLTDEISRLNAVEPRIIRAFAILNSLAAGILQKAQLCNRFNTLRLRAEMSVFDFNSLQHYGHTVSALMRKGVADVHGINGVLPVDGHAKSLQHRPDLLKSLVRHSPLSLRLKQDNSFAGFNSYTLSLRLRRTDPRPHTPRAIPPPPPAHF